MMVDLAEGAAADIGAAPAPAPPMASVVEPAIEAVAVAPAPPPAAGPAPGAPDPAQLQQMTAEIRGLFGRASQSPRWPMYVRQIKQYFRSVDAAFDERKWGFGTIMEFLRACQREGLLKLERDRRGQVRVFPGSALQATPQTESAPEAAAADELSEAPDVPEEPVDALIESFREASPEVEEEADAEFESAPRPRRSRKAPAATKPASRRAAGTKPPARRRKVPTPA
jgi:hypothetical protein